MTFGWFTPSWLHCSTTCTYKKSYIGILGKEVSLMRSHNCKKNPSSLTAFLTWKKAIQGHQVNFVLCQNTPLDGAAKWGCQLKEWGSFCLVIKALPADPSTSERFPWSLEVPERKKSVTNGLLFLPKIWEEEFFLQCFSLHVGASLLALLLACQTLLESSREERRRKRDLQISQEKNPQEKEEIEFVALNNSTSLIVAQTTFFFWHRYIWNTQIYVQET